MQMLNVSVLGDRYEESDIKIHFVDGISKHSSGVLGKCFKSIELLLFCF